MKEIPMINYIKVLILAIITVVVVLILANIYKNKVNYDRENDNIMNFLSKVSYDDLTNYLVENQDCFIYMASSYNSSFDAFEKDLKKYILENDLDSSFVYLDSNNFNDDMYKKLKDNYFSITLSNKNIKLNSSPILLAVREQKVVDVLSDNVTIENVIKFINTNEVIE